MQLAPGVANQVQPTALRQTNARLRLQTDRNSLRLSCAVQVFAAGALSDLVGLCRVNTFRRAQRMAMCDARAHVGLEQAAIEAERTIELGKAFDPPRR